MDYREWFWVDKCVAEVIESAQVVLGCVGAGESEFFEPRQHFTVGEDALLLLEAPQLADLQN